MKFDLLQPALQNTVEPHNDNVMDAMQQPGELVKGAESGAQFLQQLELEFKVFEQRLPSSGNRLPLNDDPYTDYDLQLMAPDLAEYEVSIFNDLSHKKALYQNLPILPVADRPEVKPGLQSAVFHQVNLTNSSTGNIMEPVSGEFDGEVADDGAGEMVFDQALLEVNRKSRAVTDSLPGDVKSGRGDASPVLSMMSSGLSGQFKTADSAPLLNNGFVIDSNINDHDAWGDELSSKMAWMVGRDIKVASLRVTPENLGPIEIRIQIKNELVDVHFNSSHSQVRESIEAAVPRLREMFNDQFMRLENVNISQHSFDEQQRRSRGSSEEFVADGENYSDDEADESLDISPTAAVLKRGQIDCFV